MEGQEQSAGRLWAQPGGPAEPPPWGRAGQGCLPQGLAALGMLTVCEREESPQLEGTTVTEHSRIVGLGEVLKPYVYRLRTVLFHSLAQ